MCAYVCVCRRGGDRTASSRLPMRYLQCWSQSTLAKTTWFAFGYSSNVIKEEYTNANQVVFAKVDCDQHADIAQRYRISKYTTFKLLHNGKMMKRRYRGSDKWKNLQITSGNKKVTPSRTSWLSRNHHSCPQQKKYH